MGYGKRILALGFCYVVLVVAVLIAAPENAVSGCAGDCMSCHEALVGDETHKSLGTCASCHTIQKKTYSLFPSTLVNGGCGDRCFKCHKQWPENSFHKPLDGCLECHEE